MRHLRTLYFIVANTAILLLLAVVGTHVAITTYERRPASAYRMLTEPGKRNYGHMSPVEVDELLRDTDTMRFRFAPGLGFVADAMTSRFVNIDAHGVRSNGKARDAGAIQDAIWFFGGSTALGFGVADHETIPAQLENILGRPVMNLAVPGYASSTENHLLNHYLRLGYTPAVAVFLDGINESCEQDLFEDELSMLVARISLTGYSWDVGQPVAYAYRRLSRKLKQLMGIPVPEPKRLELMCASGGKRNPLRTIHTRTLAERDALCDHYKIVCRTFVQPFAGIHGRHDDRAFLAGPDAQDMRILFEHLEPSWRAAGAIFVTDALDRSDRHAFVDSAHYSAEASRLIAEAMAIKLRSAGATTVAPPAAAPPP